MGMEVPESDDIECRSSSDEEGELVDSLCNPAGFGPLEYIMESLILAQNERWRRVLSMQVERQAVAIPPRAADW